jgi:epoxide hydrolase 4
MHAQISRVPGSPDHGYAFVNGVRLHYLSAGRGPLILFVHGFPEFSYAWKAQLEAFAADYHAVAVDLRGYNLSDKPEGVEAYRAKHVVEDLRQLIAHFGHSRCIVVAHDWGGAASWLLAARHPQCIEKLVIVNSPHPVLFARELATNPAQHAASDYMRLLIDPKAERVMAEDNFRRVVNLLTKSSTDASWLTPELLAHYREAWSQPGALTGSLNYYRASPLHPPDGQDRGAATAPLPAQEFTVRVPTLVIWGERDTALLPNLLDGLDAFVPDVRIERIANGSHWVVHEFPGRVNALIREFIQEKNDDVPAG